MSYNNAVTQLGDFLATAKIATPDGLAAADTAWRTLKDVSLATADSMRSAAEVARLRLEQRLPHSSEALAEFQRAVTRADSLVVQWKRTEDHYFVTVDSLVSHVKRTQPTAARDGEMLEFAADGDVATYNRAFALMQSASHNRIAAMTALHDHTFELLRQLAALR
jgi:hypothetical protein